MSPAWVLGRAPELVHLGEPGQRRALCGTYITVGAASAEGRRVCGACKAVARRKGVEG